MSTQINHDLNFYYNLQLVKSLNILLYIHHEFRLFNKLKNIKILYIMFGIKNYIVFQLCLNN